MTKLEIKKVDIIIVGAGLIGCSLALTLAKQKSLAGNEKFTIALVERSAQLTQNKSANQRVVALGRLATDMLSEVGVISALGDSACYPYQAMTVWDENSDGELAFNANELGQQRLGYMIDSAQCTIQLQKLVEKKNKITTYYQAQTDSLIVNETGARLALTETVLSAPLIIAADGSSSWVRQQAKIFTNHRPYQQKGIVAKIETEFSHQDTAWQRFLSTGPLALLPVNENQCSIVWSAEDDCADKLMDLSDKQFESALQQALGNRLGKVKLLTKPIAFPLISQQVETYFSRHIVLVGDAAHRIHPLAGQGANLGFKDINVLVDILTENSVSNLSDVGLLTRYENLRQTDNKQTDFLMSALHHAYQNNTPAWLSMRGLGMNMINRSKLLKGWLVNQATGS